MKFEEDKIYWCRTKELQKELMEELKEQGLNFSSANIKRYNEKGEWEYQCDIVAKDSAMLKSFIYDDKLYKDLITIIETKNKEVSKIVEYKGKPKIEPMKIKKDKLYICKTREASRDFLEEYAKKYNYLRLNTIEYEISKDKTFIVYKISEKLESGKVSMFDVLDSIEYKREGE